MTLQRLHPRDQLVAIMNRIYHNGMTTLSGGNLSVQDDHGDIWITPAGIDKGSLTPEDIMCVRADGSIVGPHRPSSELPFHRAIYRLRPDLKAIVHAHPPALVSFSIVRQTPAAHVLPQVDQICGPVGYAPYALPGSDRLGDHIAGAFAAGHNIVILENHGVAAAGPHLPDAFQRLESLEFLARTLLRAKTLGAVRTLTAPERALFAESRQRLPEFVPDAPSRREWELRREIVAIVARAVDRQLMSSAQGVVSVRLAEDSFLITPGGHDRRDLALEDIVLVRQGRREAGKLPDRSVRVHEAIYARHARIHCVMTAQCPNALAYAITSARFDSRTIPESFILLRDVPVVAFQTLVTRVESVADVVSWRHPVLLMQHNGVLTVGADILQAFDRLEVAEYSARSLIDTAVLGSLMPIGDAELRELEQAFSL